MESYPSKNKTIRAFNLRSRTSEFLPDVLPLLEADTNWQHLHRVTDNSEILQLAWEKGAHHDEEYAKLYLTLTKKALSLTVATDYRINSQPNNLSRSTLVISESSHTALFNTHKHTMVNLGYTEGEEAIQNFRAEFDNTLVGLGYKEASTNTQPAVIDFPNQNQTQQIRKPAA